MDDRRHNSDIHNSIQSFIQPASRGNTAPLSYCTIAAATEEGMYIRQPLMAVQAKQPPRMFVESPSNSPRSSLPQTKPTLESPESPQWPEWEWRAIREVLLVSKINKKNLSNRADRRLEVLQGGEDETQTLFGRMARKIIPQIDCSLRRRGRKRYASH